MRRTAVNSDEFSQRLLKYLRTVSGDADAQLASPVEPLTGGFENRLFTFTLAADELSGPLVLRLYPEHYGDANAIFETAVQNFLASQGLPVPRVHICCTDLAVLGGAFIVMDLGRGRPLVTEPLTIAARLLGETHAALHTIDPEPVQHELVRRGVTESRLSLERRFSWLRQSAKRFPEVREAVDWLLRHRPEAAEHSVMCHGDFHPLNILTENNEVTAVLDWPGFMITDPAVDIADTIVLSAVPFPQIAPALGIDPTTLDLEAFVQTYLDAYRGRRPVDGTHIPYYRVRRCVQAIVEGLYGHEIWKHPQVEQQLCEYVAQVSGITIRLR